MKNKKFRTISAILFFLAALAYGWVNTEFFQYPVGQDATHSQVQELFSQQISGTMVSVQGSVIRILKDDTKGSRHQRFIVQLNDGFTVLIAHNIDLAPRIPLNLNKEIKIFGQYEWNNKGGVIHWTHKDPQKTRAGGWVEFQGRRYH